MADVHIPHILGELIFFGSLYGVRWLFILFVALLKGGRNYDKHGKETN
jgi:hypothetical protein